MCLAIQRGPIKCLNLHDQQQCFLDQETLVLCILGSRGLCSKALSSIPVPPSSSTAFVPSQGALIENGSDYNIVESRSTSPSLISGTPTPVTAVVPLPPSPTLSNTSSISNDDISPNPNGNNTIDMGGHKSGCLLLIPHPMLDNLEELWTYAVLNYTKRKMTDEDEMKREFVACFMKFSNLRDIIDGLGPRLHLLKWVEPNPAYPNVPGMQFHKSDAEIKLLILQKITPRFRDDLCHCQVEESLPYDKWKEKCLVVKERHPPSPPAYSNYFKHNDVGCGKKDDQQVVIPSLSAPNHGPADAYSFPKLGPGGPDTQCAPLMGTEASFHCYNLFTGHQSGHCPTKGPPCLMVPYHPFTNADVMLAKLIHAKKPNNFIPYKFILKQNPASQNLQRCVTAVRPREALTKMPDLSDPASAPSSFTIQPHGIHAVYGSHPIVHSSSGAAVYSNALEHGFNYKSASCPVRHPVAALVPAWRNACEYYIDKQGSSHNLVSPSHGFVVANTLNLILPHCLPSLLRRTVERLMTVDVFKTRHTRNTFIDNSWNMATPARIRLELSIHLLLSTVMSQALMQDFGKVLTAFPRPLASKGPIVP
ncbi:hypothetical protein BT96DRAFT_940195 [Gymnopus androsaceus JB14]|uniref:Uncharacterized protein n=1 Tax=Gymnopus androsaceus JB14 TaxID=1447944 RepID=A0A6A4HL41_9AGAR|nr:hypothetical protein BT96DRAFT_940195 [Gymnopus androsaceus JB14]